MASKITRKNALTIQGVVNIIDGKITFDIEDVDGEIDFAELMKDFNGSEVKVSVNKTDELA